jgi:hypothetical protein
MMADAIYDELSHNKSRIFSEHLLVCDKCQKQYSSLQASVECLKSSGIEGNIFTDIPERAALDSMWSKLEPSLDKIDAERYRELPRSRAFTIFGGVSAVAASVVLLFSFLTLLDSPVERQTPALSSNPSSEFSTLASNQSSSQAKNKGVDAELMSYLDRAQVMLMQVANSSSPRALDIPFRDTFARNMAVEANLLSTSDNYLVNSGQKRLLNDIEFLLLQIANLDEANAAIGVQLLQQYLEDSNILFKIRLLEMRDQSPVI